tara:strand:+ start:4236 stop:5612 length:1377 start_codon:yes stop_codon:yes gene_type:complete
MKKVIITIGIIMVCFVSLKSQNTLTNNDINFNEVSYNTSFIVADSNTLVIGATSSLSSNEQETNRLNFIVYGNLKKLGLGIGAKLNSRFRNFYKTVSAEILLSKNIKISEKSDFNFGLNFGLNSNSINENYLNNYVDLSDVEIQDYENKIRFMTGAGIGFVWNKDLKIGFSMPELFKTENTFYPTFFANASYKFNFAKSDVYIEPSILLYTTSFTPVTFEGSIKAGYREFVWLKMGGRSSKTLIFGAGGGYKVINVGYSYNKNFDEYRLINESQHNINVFINFLQGAKIGKEKQIKESVSFENDETYQKLLEDRESEINKIEGEKPANSNDDVLIENNAKTNRETEEANNIKKTIEDDIDILNSLSKGRDEYVYRNKLAGEKSANYFVVVGSYAKNENANIKINSLAKEGVNAYIMTEVNSDILRICVAESETFEGILNHLNTIRNSFEPDAWIIRNE